MAAAQLIAAGIGAASSADQTVTNTPLTVALKSFDGGALVNIELKDDAAAYNPIDCLTKGNPSRVLSNPGVYRLTRLASSTSCAVFSQDASGANPLPVSVVAGPNVYTGFRDSIAPLAGNGVFTGNARSPASTDAAYMNAYAWADQAGTLFIDVSSDAGVSWQVGTSVALTASSPAQVRLALTGDFINNQQVRVRYVNGAAAQATFRLTSSFSAA